MNNCLNDYYTSIAQKYDIIRLPDYDSFQDKIRILSNDYNILNSKSILEIGCGTGNYIHELARVLGINSIGIDINSEMLVEATRKKSGENISFIHADAHSLPFESETFDTVLAVNSIHQMSDISDVFHEANRVLKKEGIFYIITPVKSKLKDFFIYTLSKKLLEYEQERLPSLKLITQTGLATGFRLNELIYPNIKDFTITRVDLINSINGKFLSCLNILDEKELNELISKVNFLEDVIIIKPYYYKIVKLTKETNES
jgi:ubiquinone/menaquinone biosynthesis C-methylase UbiE